MIRKEGLPNCRQASVEMFCCLQAIRELSSFFSRSRSVIVLMSQSHPCADRSQVLAAKEWTVQLTLSGSTVVRLLLRLAWEAAAWLRELGSRIPQQQEGRPLAGGHAVAPFPSDPSEEPCEAKINLILGKEVGQNAEGTESSQRLTGQSA